MIAIYNLEPKYFNLALEKIRKYYENQGERVDQYKPLWHTKYEKIYCGSIFTFTDKSTVTPDMICGGTGFDLTTRLPAEIEEVKVKKNIGFTTRGCIRKCPFCVVPEKEGKMSRENHMSELWDEQSDKIELLDNNWLADQEWFFENSQWLIDHKIKLKENGMDIRLIDDKIAQQLSRIRWATQPHFAWDFLNIENHVDKGLTILKTHKLNPMVYVLVNYNTTIDEDLYRIYKIRSYGCDAFVMIYDKPNAPQEIKHLARWNNRFYFRNVSFANYLKARKLTYLLSK